MQTLELHKRRMEGAKRAADDHAVRPRQPSGRRRRAPVLPRARQRQQAALPMGAGERGARELQELRANARWPRRATRVPAARRADRLPVRAVHGRVAPAEEDVLVVAYTAHLVWLQREIPNEVIISWMGATTAEIIGILWVIARSLFPFRDEHRSADLERVAAAESVTPRDKGCPDGGSFFTEGAGGFEPPGLGHTSHVTSIRSLGAAPA